MSKLRDMLLSTGLTQKEWMSQDTSDKSKYIKPQSDPDQKIKHPKDIYESGKDEKEVRKECNDWLKSQGWIVKTIYTGGVPVAGGRLATNPCKGIPDTIVFKGNKKYGLSIKEIQEGILLYIKEIIIIYCELQEIQS